MSALPDCSVARTTVTTPANWRQQSPTWLYRSIREGALHDHSRATTLPVAMQHLGEVHLGSGSLSVRDPFVVQPEVSAPIVTGLTPGTYPVYAAVAEVGDEHWRNAAAVLVLGSGTVTSWSLAMDDGGTDVGTPVGYPVDTGTGCFIDSDLVQDLDHALSQDDGRLEDPVSMAMMTQDSDHRRFAGVVSLDGAESDLAVFTSGWGDGRYPTWVGRASDGSASVVVTDFAVASGPDVVDEQPAASARATPSPRHSPKPGFWTRLFGVEQRQCLPS